MVQLSVEDLPFGGTGASGFGAYHGKHSFDCFSHKKSVIFSFVARIILSLSLGAVSSDRS